MLAFKRQEKHRVTHARTVWSTHSCICPCPTPNNTTKWADMIYIHPPPSQSKHSMLKTFAQETTCLLFKYIRVQVPKLGDFSCALLEAGINFYSDMKLISVSFLVHMLALQKAYRPLSHSRSEKQHLKKKSINKCPRRIQDLFGRGCFTVIAVSEQNG